MATKLPSSGALPDGQIPGCDPSGLILVHRIFRWLYASCRCYPRGRGRRPRSRAVVGDYAKLDFFALHLHHETEDTALWDRLNRA